MPRNPCADGGDKAARGQALAAAGRRGGGRLDAMPRAITGLKQSLSPNQLILGQHNEGNRMALNLNILLPPFCCHDLPVGGESIQEAAGVWLRVLKCCAFLVGWQTDKTADVRGLGLASN